MHLRTCDALIGSPFISSLGSSTNFIPKIGNLARMASLYCRVRGSKGSSPANLCVIPNAGAMILQNISRSRDASSFTSFRSSFSKYWVVSGRISLCCQRVERRCHPPEIRFGRGGFCLQS